MPAASFRLSGPALGKTEIHLTDTDEYRIRTSSTRQLTRAFQRLLGIRGVGAGEDALAELTRELVGQENGVAELIDKAEEAETAVVDLLDAALYPMGESRPAGDVIEEARESGDLDDETLESLVRAVFGEMAAARDRPNPPRRSAGSPTSGGDTSASRRGRSRKSPATSSAT